MHLVASFAHTDTDVCPCLPPTSAGEEVIGARAYRVVFALASLPLAVAAVVYFINHRYDGVALWNVRWVRGCGAVGKVAPLHLLRLTRGAPIAAQEEGGCGL